MRIAKIAGLLLAVGSVVACSAGAGDGTEESAQTSSDALSLSTSCYNPQTNLGGTECAPCVGDLPNGSRAFGEGALYECATATPNNLSPMCTLKTKCAYGCENLPPDNNGTFHDQCLPAPGYFTLSPATIKGGTTGHATVTLNAAHPNGATAYLEVEGNSFANPSVNLSPSQTSAVIAFPTKAVASTQSVDIVVRIEWPIPTTSRTLPYYYSEVRPLTLTH
jgi:hypothetical protein